MQALNEAYAAKGLAVLGFPCNDFGAQEPGTLDEIKSFCSTTYGADFELFENCLLYTSPSPRDRG